MSAELYEFLRSFLTDERLRRIEETLELRTRYVTVVLEKLHRTQNASACLRNCEAFGVQDVHVIPNQAGFRINRDVAQGAAQWLTIHRQIEPVEGKTRACFQSLRERNYRIVAVSARGSAGLMADYSLKSKTALVFGNELAGLSDEALSHADEVRGLPMFGLTESFNLSVAVALALGTLLPQVRQEDVPWELCETEKQELRELWVRRSLGSRAIRIEREFYRRRQANPQ